MPFRVAAITDEFHLDLEVAVRSMSELGMEGAELRIVFGKNIVDLSDDEVDCATGICNSRGLQVVSIASPVLKCERYRYLFSGYFRFFRKNKFC